MANYTGFTITSHTDVYYNRIWLLPESLDFTGLAVNTNLSVSIWNSYNVQKTLNNLFPSSGITGIGFSPFSGRTYSALELYSYTVTNQSAIPNYYSGSCLFDFTDAEDVTLFVQGQSFESFIYDNNWNTLVTEYYSYLTDIQTFNNGKEQRNRRRKNPRRGISYQINPVNNLDVNAARVVSKRIDNHLTYIYGKTTLVPIWPDLYRLTTTLNAGSGSLSGNFSNLDFQIGNFILFYKDINNYELVKLSNVTNSTLTFNTNIVNTWAANTKVVPLRKAIFSDDGLTNNYEVSFLADINPKFSILAEETDTSLRNITFTPDATYKGRNVVILSNNFTTTQNITINQRSRILDYGHTIFAPDRAWQKDKRLVPISLTLKNRTEVNKTIALFKQMCGQWKSFWLINKSCELEVTDNVGIGLSGFWVKDVGITRYRNVKTNPTYIYGIDYNDNLAMIRKITTSSLDTNNREFLSLDAVLDIAITPTTFKALGFMYLARFASDDLEISWENDTVATTQLNFIEVFDDL